jgi:periplasmic protein TonB
MKRIVFFLGVALLGMTGIVGGCMSAPSRPPEVLSAGGLVYPEEAYRQKIEGVVRVEYDVTVDGTVENARVVESNPPGVFDAAALDAVRKWRFHPAVRNGKVVATQNMVSPVKFKLGESEAYARDHD